jgi:hypothetical protein
MKVDTSVKIKLIFTGVSLYVYGILGYSQKKNIRVDFLMLSRCPYEPTGGARRIISLMHV